MPSQRKAKKVAAPEYRRHVPAAAATSAAYTTSYMVVQTLSPPLSSPPPLRPPPPTYSSAPNHKHSDVSVPPRSSTAYRLAIASTRSQRPVRQVRETAEKIASSSQSTPVVPRVNSHRASQTDASSPKAKTQQTTKLVKVLVKHKALLYGCIAEDKDEEDEDCKTSK
ncbi:hypothetical protein HD806DRAFT_138756 [Xylariaceae sp. AK1471]|nr:hypothetical protein HD806DRAFT_138756 [Xylariaceae sp. AK1471]